MKFLFLAGFAGALGGLAVGLVSGDFLMGILISLAGIGMLIFSLPFIMAPFPVYLINPIPLNFNMTVSHKCGEPDDIGEITNGDPDDGAEEDPGGDPDDDDPPKPDWGPVPGKPFEGR